MKKLIDNHFLLENCIKETSLPGRLPDYRGKVRDIYNLPGRRMAIIATDRISAFDHVFHEAIPFKGQLLNLMAWHCFQQIAPLCKHHVVDVPHPNVTIALKCDPFPIEIVVRGVLAGHAWRVYQKGGRTLCGVSLPDGLRQYEAFPAPIITPTTKAHEGHDLDITEKEILEQKKATPAQWNKITRTALALFQKGREAALRKGLILADTKYEFGWFDNELILIDEVHTTDSSRYFYADGYHERLASGSPQIQLSKEFLREWLINNGHHETMDQKLPALPDTLRLSIYERYRELYEKLTGTVFEPVPATDFSQQLEALLKKYQ